ncbi:MAG: SUMF1/EgtB/PvdO family nonheme iron enzyme [Candidatus Solibacter sp.]|nr:SUMF1/EgtB/PvdO family nonheme iron enzyme [Candidatus Solibacter sp.]
MTAVVWLCVALACLPLYGQTAEPGARGSGKRVLAVIGVGNYRDSVAWPSIPAAEKSALAVLKIIPDVFGYAAAPGAPLGSGAAAASVNAYLDRVISGLSPEDDLIVYFAGHGKTIHEQIDGQMDAVGYLVPFDAPAVGSAGLLRIRTILEKLDAAPSRNILVILDACESAVALPRLAPGNSRGRARSGMSRVVITSAEAQQSAVAQGNEATLFSGILLDLLKSGNCDISGDGYCAATELALLARRRLAALPVEQNPERESPTVSVFGGEEAADFRLYRYGAEVRDWVNAKACTTVEECADTSKLERFLKAHPAEVYASAAKKLLRERVEMALRKTGRGVTSDLRLITGNVKDSLNWKKDESVSKEEEIVFKWVPDSQSQFWMAKYEVSVDQYRRFAQVMPRAPSYNRNWSDGKQPMVHVSWSDAKAFCASMGGTLPTFDQWVRAALANQAYRFPWNDDVKCDWANLAAKCDKSPFPVPVDAFSAGQNVWQIHNLIGNVAEWTSTLMETDVGPKAVVVGGSFADTWQKAGLQWRSAAELNGSNTVGFRCIVAPELQKAVKEER